MAALMRKRAGFLIGDMLVGISFLTCFLVFSLPLLRTIQHEQDYSRLALWTYEAASVIAAAQDGALLENRPVTLRRLPLPSAGHGSLSLQRAVPLKAGWRPFSLKQIIERKNGNSLLNQ